MELDKLPSNILPACSIQLYMKLFYVFQYSVCVFNAILYEFILSYIYVIQL
jgi:hypothetical protein